MERTYLQWNFVNWITILLMVTGGWLIVGLISSAVRSKMNGNSE